MKNISLWILLAVALLLPDAMPLDCLAYQQSRKTIAVKSVTGSYKYVLNTVEVLELPDHRVRISFSGFWPNDHKRVETRNVGSFDETVPLKGHTAVVKPEYGDECAITFNFKPSRVIVSQEGYRCGFGFNVEADGTYVKVSSKPPDLTPLEKRTSE
jgi:hypothetical protein